jgi:hypothetical protein
VLAGHHQSLRFRVLCLYRMSLNLSNRQIAQELALSVVDVQAMTEHLRAGLVAKAPAVVLENCRLLAYKEAIMNIFKTSRIQILGQQIEERRRDFEPTLRRGISLRLFQLKTALQSNVRVFRTHHSFISHQHQVSSVMWICPFSTPVKSKAS